MTLPQRSNTDRQTSKKLKQSLKQLLTAPTYLLRTFHQCHYKSQNMSVGHKQQSPLEKCQNEAAM